MNRTMRHRVLCALAAAMLAAASLGTPARAADAEDPEGVPTMIRYAGCALGIGLAKTPQALTMGVYFCLQMLYDEAMKH